MSQGFQGINRLFVLAFENDAQRTSKRRYYIPNVEIKDYNVMIDGKKKFFYQPVKNDNITYESIRKVATGQVNYITGCLLDYAYFKNYYKMIAIDLSKQ